MGHFILTLHYGNNNKLRLHKEQKRAKVIFFLLLILDTPKKRLKRRRSGFSLEGGIWRRRRTTERFKLLIALHYFTLLRAIRASLLYVPLNQAYAENRMNEGLSLYHSGTGSFFLSKELIYCCGQNCDKKKEKWRPQKFIFLGSTLHNECNLISSSSWENH